MKLFMKSEDPLYLVHGSHIGEGSNEHFSNMYFCLMAPTKLNILKLSGNHLMMIVRAIFNQDRWLYSCTLIY
jgi:hypothetical protein